MHIKLKSIFLRISYFILIFIACTDALAQVNPEDFGYNSIPVEGERPLLTILLEFSDTRFASHHTPSYYRRILFAPSEEVDGKLALRSWWSPSRRDNFTTSDSRWAGNLGDFRLPDYGFNRIEGYIEPPSSGPQPGKVPLYSWWSPSRSDNFMTSDPRWAGELGDTKSPDYRFVRLEGYVNSPDIGRSLPNIAGIDGFFYQNSNEKFRFTDVGVLGPFVHPDDPTTGVNESRLECAWGREPGCNNGTNSNLKTLANAILLAHQAGFDFGKFDRNSDGKITNNELVVLVVGAQQINGDNFATTNPEWAGTSGDVINSYGFVRIEGHVDSPDSPQPPGTIPLYHWHSRLRSDNFTTSDRRWAGRPGDTRSPDYRGGPRILDSSISEISVCHYAAVSICVCPK